jgi:ribosomal protein L32
MFDNEELTLCPNCEDNKGEWIIQHNWFICPVCGEMYYEEEFIEKDA